MPIGSAFLESIAMKPIVCCTRALVIALLLSSCGMVNATRRALIIGIGAYAPQTGWATISGDRDVPNVRQMLISKGFEPAHIATLTNESATAEGIRQALRTLIDESQKGDFVYIHFSGHGQRITDTSGDEQSGFDEAWVPYDAQLRYEQPSGLIFKSGGYAGQNHLVDDELNEYLHSIRERVGKSGHIIVIADACHSGGGSRLADDKEENKLVVRGTSDDFIIPQSVTTQQVGNHPVEWIYISACKSNQCNYEYQGSGSLTYALMALSDRFEKMSCEQLQRELRRMYRDLVPFVQTPTVESSQEQQSFF